MFNTRSDRSLGHQFYVFFFLYFVQGIPFGFQTRYLPILFRKNGMELAHVGLFKLLMIPWVFKAVWARIVDNYFTRKFWLNVSLLTLFVLCIVASFVPPTVLTQLAVVMFLFNVVTSVQDIALDSYVIESLSPRQLAQGNIAQVVGYKFGGLFAGGVFSMLSDIFDWKSIFFSLGGTYILGLFVSLLFLQEEDNVPESRERTVHDTSDIREDFSSANAANSTSSYSRVRCYYSSLLQTDGTMWIMVFVLFYKVGEMGATNMFPMFMLDKGISSHTAGFWTAFIGQAVSMCGSVLGGLNPRSLYYNLSVQLLLTSLSTLFILLCILLWETSGSLAYGLSVLALQVAYLTGGATTTATYTLAMLLSQMTTRRCRASHYTLITTSDVIGRLLFAPVVAGTTQLLGYPLSFFLFSLASFLVLFLLSFAPAIVKRQ